MKPMCNTLYTTEIHAGRLEKMLSENNACASCPAGRKYKWVFDPADNWKNETSDEICFICRKFININPKIKKPSPMRGGYCPCLAIGKQKALDRSLAAIADFKRENKC